MSRKIRLNALEKRQLTELKVNGRTMFRVNSAYDLPLRLLSEREIRSIRKTFRKERHLYDKLIEQAKETGSTPAERAVIESVTSPRAPYFEFYAKMSLKKAQQYRHAVARRKEYKSFRAAARVMHPSGGTLIANYKYAVSVSASNAGVSEKLLELILGWFDTYFYDGYVLAAAIEGGEAMGLSHSIKPTLPDVGTLTSDIYFNFGMLYNAFRSMGMPDYATEIGEDLEADLEETTENIEHN